MELTKMANQFPDISENEILRDFLAASEAHRIAKAEMAVMVKITHPIRTPSEMGKPSDSIPQLLTRLNAGRRNS